MSDFWIYLLVYGGGVISGIGLFILFLKLILPEQM